MKDLTIIDDSFDLNITSSYHISILAHSTGLSFAIMDTVRMKFLAFKHNTFGEALSGSLLYEKIESILAIDGYLNQNYKKLYFSIISPKATLVPSPIFDSAKKASYNSYLQIENEDSIVLDNYISTIDSYIIYSIPSRLYNQAINILDTPQFFHQSHPMIENAVTSAKSKSGKSKVYVNINHGFMDAIVVNNGQFQLSNSFSYKTDKDQVFYILYLYDQFKLPNESTILEISGEVQEDSEMIRILRKHIRNVNFQQFNRGFSYSYTFNELIQYQFSNLINLFRCE